VIKKEDLLRNTLIVVTALIAIVCGPVVSAQAPAELAEPMPAPATPEAWGTADASTLSVSCHGFSPRSSSYTFDVFWNTGYMYQSGGTPGMFYAPFDLPAGAQITAISADGYDVHATENLSWGILRMTPDHNGDQGIGWYYYGTSAGYFTSTATLGTPHTVDHANYYAFIIDFNVASQDIRLRGMRVHYTLQVSPAPGVATFGDVPTSHMFFQYVEALAASGITAGCGGGNYCPDNPVTRGQMAVFLSKALGLHWTP
jgi:hypothetical protein